MATPQNNNLLKRTAEILDNGTDEQKAIVQRLLEINDWPGLQWVVNHVNEEEYDG